MPILSSKAALEIRRSGELSTISAMPELKLTSQHPDLKSLIETVIAESLSSVEAGIQRTQERIRAFETQYQLSTEEFLTRYENDALQETLEFDE
jgi:hypothetical protein